MNEATRQKFAAILAAQLAKVPQTKFQATTTPKPAELPAPTPTPAPAVIPAAIPAAKPATAPQAGKSTISAAIDRMNKATPMPDVKEFTTLEDITKAAEDGQTISILNLYNLVNDKPQAPARELSKYTFEELINTPEEEPQTQEPAPATTAKKCDIEIKEYNAASFTVRGKDTYKIKDELRANGGAWNRYLKEGAAWIFSKKKYYTVKTLIEKSF